LHCSKYYGKICSTLNGLTQQSIQVIPLSTSVSSTLLQWSGFKRNPNRVAFFFAGTGGADRVPGAGTLVSGVAGGQSVTAESRVSAKYPSCNGGATRKREPAAD
jgi:hypothetical protein